MSNQRGDHIVVLAFDIFGTTVDWRTGVADQVAERPAEKGPHRVADRAAAVTSDIAVTGFAQLAEMLGCQPRRSRHLRVTVHLVLG